MGQTDESQFSVEERAVMGMILSSLDLDLLMQLVLMIYKLVSLIPALKQGVLITTLCDQVCY